MVCFYSYSVSGRRGGIDTDNIQFNSNPSQGSKEEINCSGHKKYFGYCCYIIPIANIFKVLKTPIFKDIHVLGLVRGPSDKGACHLMAWTDPGDPHGRRDMTSTCPQTSTCVLGHV